MGMKMGKMGEQEGLKMKTKRRFGIKVKKVSEKGQIGWILERIEGFN